MSDLFALRSRELRRRRLQRIALGVLAVVVAGLLAWVVWFSSVLAVTSVTVDGERTLTDAQVRRVASVEDGRPLARTDLDAIETRVMTIDRVESVSVSRSWPRTISIDVVERVPVMWLLDAGQVRGIDRHGIDYRSYRSEPESLLEAEISVTESKARIDTIRSVAAVVQFISANDPALRRQVQSISAGSKDSIELDLTRGRTVVWGSRADGDRKLTVLEPLLQIKAVRYDVSAPDQPTTRR